MCCWLLASSHSRMKACIASALHACSRAHTGCRTVPEPSGGSRRAPGDGAQQESGQDAGGGLERGDEPEGRHGRERARQQAVDVAADPQRQRAVHEQVHEPDACARGARLAGRRPGAARARRRRRLLAAWVICDWVHALGLAGWCFPMLPRRFGSTQLLGSVAAGTQ